VNTALHDVSTEARDYHGRWEKGGSGELSLKALIAKANYRPTKKKVQRYAEAQEDWLASQIGGRTFATSAAFDVILKRKNGTMHGVEVKTKTHGTQQEITMNSRAVKLKVEWHKAAKNRVIHTVVLDHRDKFAEGANKHLYSGHDMYYRRGVGKQWLSSMHKVNSIAELKRLIDMPYNSLPPKAQGKIR